MKNLKSLQVVALAGVALALTAGCSSTSSTRADYNHSSDENAAYRYASPGGWVPITDIRKVAAFPFGWTPGDFGPVSYETYIFTPPTGEMATGRAAMTSSGTSSTTISTDGSSTTISSDHPASTTIASDGTSTTITTSGSPQFNENLQPGDTFVEAAGANSDSPKVRRVILYSPFGSTGVGN